MMYFCVDCRGTLCDVMVDESSKISGLLELSAAERQLKALYSIDRCNTWWALISNHGAVVVVMVRVSVTLDIRESRWTLRLERG